MDESKTITHKKRSYQEMYKTPILKRTPTSYSQHKKQKTEHSPSSAPTSYSPIDHKQPIEYIPPILKRTPTLYKTIDYKPPTSTSHKSIDYKHQTSEDKSLNYGNKMLEDTIRLCNPLRAKLNTLGIGHLQLNPTAVSVIYIISTRNQTINLARAEHTGDFALVISSQNTEEKNRHQEKPFSFPGGFVKKHPDEINKQRKKQKLSPLSDQKYNKSLKKHLNEIQNPILTAKREIKKTKLDVEFNLNTEFLFNDEFNRWVENIQNPETKTSALQKLPCVYITYVVENTTIMTKKEMEKILSEFKPNNDVEIMFFLRLDQGNERRKQLKRLNLYQKQVLCGKNVLL